MTATRLSLVATLLLAGCYNPDLSGPGGFKCVSDCPEGFSCVNGACVREGQPPPDGPVVEDQGPGTEGGTPDGPVTDGPLTDGPLTDVTLPDGQVPQDQGPLNPCTVSNPVNVSPAGAGSSFSFGTSLQGNAAVSFVQPGSVPAKLMLNVRTGTTWLTAPKEIYDLGAGHSAVGFDKNGQAMVAFHSLHINSLKLSFTTKLFDVDTAKGAGVFVTLGPHPGANYKTLSYQVGSTLKYAEVSSDPDAFTKTVNSIPPATGVTGGIYIAQGLVGSASAETAFAYLSSDKPPTAVLSVYNPLAAGNKWTHSTVETVNTQLSSSEYGVGLAVSAPAGPPMVWSSWMTGPHLRYRNGAGTIGPLWPGGRPTYARASGHEAIAYVVDGSLYLRTRKQTGQGAWSPAVPVEMKNATTGVTISREVVKTHLPTTTGTKGVWEVVYLSGKTQNLSLWHRTVKCTY